VISVEEALRAVGVAAGAPRARPETVALADALGRVLAEDVAMDHDAPPFDRSTMDGFAVRSEDAARPGAVLAVVARGVAGAAPPRPVGRGEAASITTGAPIPGGADAVVPVEVTEAVDGERGRETRVRLQGAVRAGACVSRRGEQARAGEVVLARGSRVHAASVGVLATAGRTRVAVAARPRVEVVATGDEVVPASARPGPTQVRDGNGHALAAQVAREGGAATYRGPVRDDERALTEAIARGLAEADLVCVTGGVSMGEKDLVPGVLASLGVERLFHRWAVKPGGPLWAGRKGDVLVFGLPGNPAAAFVGFELLVVPALRTRLGLPFAPRETVRATFDGVTGAPIPRRLVVPVRMRHEGTEARALPVPWTGSGDPFGLARADGLALVPEGTRVEVPGTALVDVVPLGAPA
jgi:molybdopterin molybdotransferase